MSVKDLEDLVRHLEVIASVTGTASIAAQVALDRAVVALAAENETSGLITPPSADPAVCGHPGRIEAAVMGSPNRTICPDCGDVEG